MANEPIVSTLGGVSAYLDAVAHGFSGTREEFGELLANGATYYQRAETAAQNAERDAGTASSAATAAAQNAQTASGAASTATAAAQSASTDAGTASTAAGTASAAAESASGSAASAATSASNAGQFATNADLSAQEAAATLAAAEAAIEAKGAEVEAEVDGYIADAQTAINTLEEQKDTIAQTVASMAQLGTDTTLTTQGMAADAKASGDRIDVVESAFNIEEHKSLNLLDSDEIESGCYYWTNGRNESASYNSTPFIPVTPGQKLWCQYGYSTAASRQKANLRFVTGYDSNKQVISASAASNVYSYTVPQGVSYVILSIASNLLIASQLPVILDQDEDVIQDYIPYFDPYQTKILKEECNNDPHIQSIVNQTIANESGKLIFTATSDSLAANTNLICCERSDNKKNEYIELTSEFETFGELTIAHGKNSYGGGYITITESKLQIYTYDGTLIEEYEHGLTISGFINVIVYTKNDTTYRPKITIMSSGGDYTAETTRYYSCRAAVLCNATFAMTNVKMQYVVNDAKEDVWVFGDSYISLGDQNRWATQLMSEGHKNLLLNGFGGAASAKTDEVYRVLELFTSLALPKFIVWCLGMNNGDNGAVNSGWKDGVDSVLSICEAKGITPILATIPNVPSIDHTYKNAYVKSLNVRYVDFAKAVNAESAGATWYTGMLSSDNTHPTALGAKALMRQFLLDVPEVLYAEE